MQGFNYSLANSLKTKITTISLSNSNKYSTSFSIQGVQLKMLCGYNIRNKLRWIILSDRNGNAILPQTFLTNGKRCELGFYANQQNLNYFLYLKPRNESVDYDGYDYIDWKDSFDLCFVGFSQEQKDIMNSNTRKLLVGN